MESIAQCAGWCLGSREMYIGRHGILEKTHTGKGLPDHLKSCKRGKVRGFSAGSVRRLRETLFCKRVERSYCLGTTFTVPWKTESCTPAVLKRFHATFNRFRVRFVTDFPHSSFIYRVELQKRGAPHLHCVVYVSIDDCESDLAGRAAAMPDMARRALAKIAIRDLWVASLDSDITWAQYRSAERHSVAFDDLSGADCGALFRYLCDHASKKKQAQLGYPGRQWGVIGRNNLVSDDLVDLGDFPSAHCEGVFWRMIKKLTRYRISDELRSKKWKRSPVFGCVYRGGNRKRGVVFVKGGGDAVRRCYDFAVAQHCIIEKGR